MFQYSVASLWFVLIVLLRFTCFFNMFLVIVLLTFPKKRLVVCVSCFLFLYWSFLSGLNCVRSSWCVLFVVCFSCVWLMLFLVLIVSLCVFVQFLCVVFMRCFIFLICNFVCFDMCCLCDIFIYTILHIYIYIIVFVCI